MRVLADLAHQCAAVAFRHRVVGFDLFLAVDARLEQGEKLVRFGGA